MNKYNNSLIIKIKQLNDKIFQQYNNQYDKNNENYTDISPPEYIKKVKSLERELQLKIFITDNEIMELTNDKNKLLTEIKQIKNELNNKQ